MTINQDGGNVPSMSRWARARKYPCTHPECEAEAVVTKATPDVLPHNCCNKHEEGVNND